MKLFVKMIRLIDVATKKIKERERCEEKQREVHRRNLVGKL